MARASISCQKSGHGSAIEAPNKRTIEKLLFSAFPKNLVHFTTAAGAGGIATSATINATRFGLFGLGAYMAAVGRPLNLFVRAAARVPISLATPAGTARIIPYLVYVRWGLAPIVLP